MSPASRWPAVPVPLAAAIETRVGAVVSMVNVRVALLPVLPPLLACVAWAVYVPWPSVVTLVDHVLPLRVTERVRTGVPVAADPE